MIPSGGMGLIVNAVLSILVIAMLALAWGGYQMIAKRGQTQKGVLMLVCALVLLANVLIWTI